MISREELLKGASIPNEFMANFEELYTKINKIRSAYGKPMFVNSCFRSKDDQIRVYKQLAKSRGIPFDETKIPWGSAHLKAAAVDIADDSNFSLHKWCVKNEKLLAEIGLWCEVQDDQRRVHFQIFPPKSGKRFFNP